MKKITFDRKIRRRRRISTNIVGTKERPRISVFRSNKYIYVQAIDDADRTTLVAFSSFQLRKKNASAKLKKSEAAKQVGMELAKLLKEKKILSGVLDRNIYAYLGRVKALTEGLREGGLII